MNGFAVHRRTLITLLAAAVLLAAGPAALAKPGKHDLNAGVVEPNKKAYGQSYGEWGAAWWTWALELPAANHPLLDETGDFCDAGQQGPVWFLAGNFGGETERTCAIPSGKALLVPVFNSWADNVPPDYPDTTTLGFSKKELTDLCEQTIANPETLSVELDGKPLNDLDQYLVKPTRFSFAMPANGLYTEAFGVPFSGEIPKPGAVSCGYYLLLEPLQDGEYLLRIEAANSRDADPRFSLVVTYHLEIG
jgi:hypothetical protein